VTSSFVCSLPLSLTLTFSFFGVTALSNGLAHGRCAHPGSPPPRSRLRFLSPYPLGSFLNCRRFYSRFLTSLLSQGLPVPNFRPYALLRNSYSFSPPRCLMVPVIFFPSRLSFGYSRCRHAFFPRPVFVAMAGLRALSTALPYFVVSDRPRTYGRVFFRSPVCASGVEAFREGSGSYFGGGGSSGLTSARRPATGFCFSFAQALTFPPRPRPSAFPSSRLADARRAPYTISAFPRGLRAALCEGPGSVPRHST